jgi:hypothetical protein
MCLAPGEPGDLTGATGPPGASLMPSPGGRQEDEEDWVVAEPALYEGLGGIFAIDAAEMVT